MISGDSPSTFRPNHMQPPAENLSDVFDHLPDVIILTIFNYISDIKTLTRCRGVSRRFNSLVTQSDSLILRVDRVISAVDSDHDGDSSTVIGFIKSIVKSIHSLIHQSSNEKPESESESDNHQSEIRNSPAMILRGFERIKSLEIELPNGDLRLEKLAGIKWRAEFGKSLKSCVILGFRCGGVTESDLSGGGGLKTRVVWTISALIAASARHFMVKEIVNDNVDLSRLIIKDNEHEGLVMMNELGIKEFRNDISENVEDSEGQTSNFASGNGNGGVWWRSNRTRVPAVWMRMRHESKLELSNGVVMEGATLVVVRPVGGEEEERWDEGLVANGNGFDGVYGEAVAKLIKRRSYLLEMNSF